MPVDVAAGMASPNAQDGICTPITALT